MSTTKRSATGPKRARRVLAHSVAHEHKREQILEVAEDLFFKRGYAGTTIADIAEKLGVTKPFVYYYFQNKEDLFETLSWQASVASLSSMQTVPGDQRRAIDRLHEGMHRLANANLKHFKSGTFYYREPGVLRAPFLRKIRQLARDFHEDLCALLEAARADGDAHFEDTKLTALAVGSIIGFMFVWYKPNGSINAETIANKLTRILLRTVGADPSRTLNLLADETERSA